MIKHLDDLDSLGLGHRAVYEPWETAVVTRDLKPEQTFIDIGAHIGYYSLMASALVGKKGKVFAFEPEPKNFSILTQNVADHHIPNIEIFNCAISSDEGIVNMFLNPKNSGDNRVGIPNEGWESIPVLTYSIDFFFQFYQGKIDFTKIDVQGHELEVLSGMKKTIEKYPDLKIIIEYSPILLSMVGHDPEEMIIALKDYGFTILTSRTHDFRKCTVANKRHTNIYARRENGNL